MSKRNPAERKHHPQGASTPHQFRWHWSSRELRPGQRLPEHDYILPENDPILAAVKTYERGGDWATFDVHAALECGFVIQGRVTRYWGSTEHQRVCGPGAAWFCPSYEPNGYRLVEVPCRLVVFEIRPQFISSLQFPESPDLDWLLPFTGPLSQRPRRVPDVAAVTDLGNRLDVVLKRGGPLRALAVRALVMEFLLMFMKPRRRGGRSTQARELQERLRPALDLMMRARLPVRNAAAAAACGLSTSQFVRAFQKIMGTSAVKFALHHRIQGAATEVATTDHPFKAIAPEWGFADESHMHHLFVKHLKCTPGEYRNRGRPAEKYKPASQNLQ